MTNNPTIDGVSRELLRKQFEEKNEHRGWFVAGGNSEIDTPEGFVYGDLTTDMCWTCYFEANDALQSTIAQLQIDLSNQTELTKQADYHASQRGHEIAQLQARVAELESGRGEPVAYAMRSGLERIASRETATHSIYRSKNAPWDVPLFTTPPAPVAVVLPKREMFHGEMDNPEIDFNKGWNACLDATAALNEVKP